MKNCVGLYKDLYINKKPMLNIENTLIFKIILLFKILHSQVTNFHCILKYLLFVFPHFS